MILQLEANSAPSRPMKIPTPCLRLNFTPLSKQSSRKMNRVLVPTTVQMAESGRMNCAAPTNSEVMAQMTARNSSYLKVLEQSRMAVSELVALQIKQLTVTPMKPRSRVVCPMATPCSLAQSQEVGQTMLARNAHRQGQQPQSTTSPRSLRFGIQRISLMSLIFIVLFNVCLILMWGERSMKQLYVIIFRKVRPPFIRPCYKINLYLWYDWHGPFLSPQSTQIQTQQSKIQPLTSAAASGSWFPPSAIPSPLRPLLKSAWQSPAARNRRPTFMTELDFSPYLNNPTRYPTATVLKQIIDTTPEFLAMLNAQMVSHCSSSSGTPVNRIDRQKYLGSEWMGLDWSWVRSQVGRYSSAPMKVYTMPVMQLAWKLFYFSFLVMMVAQAHTNIEARNTIPKAVITYRLFVSRIRYFLWLSSTSTLLPIHKSISLQLDEIIAPAIPMKMPMPCLKLTLTPLNRQSRTKTNRVPVVQIVQMVDMGRMNCPAPTNSELMPQITARASKYLKELDWSRLAVSEWVTLQSQQLAKMEMKPRRRVVCAMATPCSMAKSQEVGQTMLARNAHRQGQQPQSQPCALRLGIYSISLMSLILFYRVETMTKSLNYNQLCINPVCLSDKITHTDPQTKSLILHLLIPDSPSLLQLPHDLLVPDGPIERLLVLQGLQAGDVDVGAGAVGNFDAGRVVIVAVLDVVVVEQLGHVLDPPEGGQLEQRVHQGVVVDGVQPLPVAHLVVQRWDVVEGAHPPRSNRPEDADPGPIDPAQQVLAVGVDRPAAPVAVVVGLVVAVGHPQVPMRHIHSIHDLKCIPAYELIIAVHQQLHIVLPTEIVRSIDNIISGVVTTQILNKGNTALREANLTQVLDGGVHVAVGRVVVNEHNVIVLVLLHDGGFEHFEVSVVLDVVVAEDSHAETNLLTGFVVLVDLVLLVEVGVLDGLDGVALGQVPRLLLVHGKLHVGRGQLGGCHCAGAAEVYAQVLESGRVERIILRQSDKFLIGFPLSKNCRAGLNVKVPCTVARIHGRFLYLLTVESPQFLQPQRVDLDVTGHQERPVGLGEVIAPEQLKKPPIEGENLSAGLVSIVGHPGVELVVQSIQIADGITVQGAVDEENQSVLHAVLQDGGMVTGVGGLAGLDHGNA